MKNLYFATLLLISFQSFCQSSKIKFGVQGGLNYSNLKGYTIPDYFEIKERAGFAYLGGVNIEYQLKSKLSLRLELNFERKTQKVVDNEFYIISGVDGNIEGNYNYDIKKNYDYLTIPMLAKYYFKENNSFFINGGPFIGYLLKSTVTNDLEEIKNLNNDDLVTTNNHTKLDFGLTFGLGKNFAINEKNAISIEIRENLGLVNISKNPVWGNGTIKTNSIGLLVGYSF
jgi:hypothetical protein